MRLTLSILFLFLAAAAIVWRVMLWMPGKTFSGSPAPLSAKEAELRDALHRDVRTLAGEIGERNLVRYEALQSAASFLEGQLQAAGYTVVRQNFEVETPGGPRVATNLVVERPGTSRPGEVIVVGAHYDSREGTPGADDNASGTASVLALARLFAGFAPDRTLRFVLFTNEEYFRQDLMGSLVYAKLCRSRNEQIVGMLSLESMGYFSDVKGSQKYPFPINLFYPDMGSFLGFVGNIGSRDLVRSTIEPFRAVAAIPSEGVAAPDAIEGIGWSDHWAFWQQGYPAIMVTDTAPFRNPHYHQPTDTPETLNYERLARVTRGLEAAIRSLVTVR